MLQTDLLSIIRSLNTVFRAARICHALTDCGKKLRADACYHLAQNLLSSRLLSKNLKIKIYRTIILPVVLYGCETWSLILQEERKLRVFENMVLRRIFGPGRDEVTGEWRRVHNKELMICTAHPILCA